MERAIEASVALAESLWHVRAALIEEPGLLVAAAPAESGGAGDRYDSALAIEIGDGTTVQQAMICELGPSARVDEALVVPVRWQPTSHQHLLPAFAGEFELSAEPPGTRLVLRGAYTVPLGPAGRVGDRVAGRRLAQRVLDRHLESVAQHLDQAAGHAATAATGQPASAPENAPGSENYIG